MNEDRSSPQSLLHAFGYSVGQLLAIVSFLAQFLGAYSALQTNWLRLAFDMRTYAAVLSALLSLGTFSIGWYQGSVLRKLGEDKKVISIAVLSLAGLILSFVVFWFLNNIYGSESSTRL